MNQREKETLDVGGALTVTEKGVSVLALLQQHIKEMPIIHPLPFEWQSAIKGNDVADYERFYDEVKVWRGRLLELTQALQLEISFNDDPLWRNSRFDYNAQYMRYDDFKCNYPDLAKQLEDKPNHFPIEFLSFCLYRRGTRGIEIYKVKKHDFKMPRERKNHRLERLGANNE